MAAETSLPSSLEVEVASAAVLAVCSTACRTVGPEARTIHHTHKGVAGDIYKGKISEIALQRSIICPKCEGRGGKEGAVRRCGMRRSRNENNDAAKWAP